MKRSVRVVLAFGILMVPLLPPAQALATPPGANGDIAFRRYLGPDRTKGTIFMAARDGSGERQLTTPPGKAGDDYPDVAPDGSFVAFQRCGRRDCGIYTVRPDGTGVDRVDHRCTRRRCPENSYPAVSPDGEQIAFVHLFAKPGSRRVHVGIYRMRLDGSHVRRVTLPGRRDVEDGDPQWSPDGTRIVFVRHHFTESGDRQAVFLVAADGTGVRRLTPYRLRAGDGPDWSPDGSQILFRSPETEDFLDSDIWTIHPDGTGLRQVTHAGSQTKVYSASFSPDGTAVTVGMSGVGDQADVYTIGIDGTGLAPVTRTSTWDSAPDWGPVF
jgi:Tol biopolymer transport system component